MILAEREKTIIDFINQRHIASVRELAERCDVTEVTIRRDLQRLEKLRLLQRTHGGAVSVHELKQARNSNPNPTSAPSEQELAVAIEADALVLAPVKGGLARTLREHTSRAGIPVLAESDKREGAAYLGPDNLAAGRLLGEWTGRAIQEATQGEVVILDLSQPEQANTRERSLGFYEGMSAALGIEPTLYRVNAGFLFNEAYQVAISALRLHPEINVIFGINDDLVLGGLQAYADLGYDEERLIAVNVGGEGGTLFDVLLRGGPLRACVALFPEVVGRLAVDASLRHWAGETMPTAMLTPYALLTRETIYETYRRTDNGWQLRADALGGVLRSPLMIENRLLSCYPAAGKKLVFIVQHPTHEWYQNLTRAMQTRAAEVGVTFSVQDVFHDLKAIVRDLRRQIGKAAASYVETGEIIILDAGSTTVSMAGFLADRASAGSQHITVITNSLDVFNRLRGQPHISLILTGGEFDSASNAFVGRSAQLVLRERRADKAFIVAAGVSSAFGVSSLDGREAEMRLAMMNAAREVVVLADHTVLGMESNVRVSDLDTVNTLITDAGVPSEQTLDLRQRGIKVVVTGQLGNGERDDTF